MSVVGMVRLEWQGSMMGGNLMLRCEWCLSDPAYVKYHDEEWGTPVHEDRRHFEFLLLESAQSGLSWMTILRKRENYRKAYDGFDVEKIAAYGEDKVEALLNDAGIIRNRRKIEASVNNALRFLEVQSEFGSFDRYIWDFVDGSPVVNHYDNISQVPAVSGLSDEISRDLRKRGFKHLGSITLYAHLQAIGVIDDHIDGCFRKKSAV